MVKTLELTEAGTVRLNAWLAEVGKPGLNMQRVAFDLLDVLQSRASMDESLHVELAQQYTSTGRPETLTFHASEVEVTTEPDDE